MARAEQLIAEGNQENGKKRRNWEFSTPYPFLVVLDLNATLEKTWSYRKAFSSWQKNYWGVVKHRRFSTKRRAAPEQGSNIQEREGEVVGPSCKRQERKLCWV